MFDRHTNRKRQPPPPPPPPTPFKKMYRSTHTLIQIINTTKQESTNTCNYDFSL